LRSGLKEGGVLAGFSLRGGSSKKGSAKRKKADMSVLKKRERRGPEEKGKLEKKDQKGSKRDFRVLQRGGGTQKKRQGGTHKSTRSIFPEVNS